MVTLRGPVRVLFGGISRLFLLDSCINDSFYAEKAEGGGQLLCSLKIWWLGVMDTPQDMGVW